MKKRIMSFIRNYLSWAYRPIKYAYPNYLIFKQTKKDVERLNKLSDGKNNKVFYLGITAHSNMGDIAQHYCITKWIEDNFPDYELIMFESNTVVSNRFIKAFKNKYKESDIIVFQSGYTTTDLGGNHEEMHRKICDNLPNARILMMPQTILFMKKKNQNRCSESYNKARRMLFLARDSKSFKMAQSMFPDIRVMTFPDIVTSLIGTLKFNYNRQGVCLCVRNDGEKYYSDSELKKLKCNLEILAPVTVTDTQSLVGYKELRANKQKYVEEAIGEFSKYFVTITDRYHGTIFSLCAGTPVIVIKTTDHKVITGADWFNGIYDDYVFVANNLDDAYDMAKSIMSKKITHSLKPYFKEKYYDKLKSYLMAI